VALRDPDFSIDRAELEAAFGPRTKAIVINTPHNPSGKVFTRSELEAIASLCRRHDTLAITDEIYEHIIYGGARHVSIASLAGMAERTVTISGLSKTYSITGWRLAYAIASERITAAIRKVHDFLTVGAPHPLQEAGAVALRLPGRFMRN
jgi:aminotransferase